MSKTISVSARISEEIFEQFKTEYLQQLKESFNEDTPPEIIESVLDVSNSDLVSMAVRFALKHLQEKKTD